MNGQELNCSDAQTLEVINHRLRGQPQIGTAERWGDIGMALRSPLYVRFVDDGLLPRNSRRAVALPGEGFFDNGPQRSMRGAIKRTKRTVGLRAGGVVAVQALVPLKWAPNRLCVRVKQDLVWIESQAFVRIVRPINAISVELAGAQVHDVAMPDGPRLLVHFKYMAGVLVGGGIKQQQFYFFGMGAVQGKVYADTIPRSTPWIRFARTNAQSVLNTPSVGRCVGPRNRLMHNEKISS